MTKRFAGQVVSLLTADAALEGVQLVVKSASATLLGPALFGLLTLLQLIPQYAEKLFRIGVDEGSTYVASRHPDRVGVVFFNTAILVGFCGCVAIGVFLCVRGPFGHYLLKDAVVDGATLAAILASIPALFLFRAFMKNLLYVEDLRWFNGLNCGIPLLGQVLVLTAVLCFGTRLFPLVMGPLIAYALGSAAGGWRLYRLGRLSPKWDGAVQRELTAYGIKVYLPIAVQFLHWRIDLLLIGTLLTPEAVGFYSLAATFAQVLYKLPSVVSSLLYPKGAREATAEGASALTVLTCRHSMTVLGVALLPFWIGVEAAVHFGMPAYAPMLPAFRILVVAWTIVGLAQLLHSYFLSRGQPRISLIIFAATLPINVLGNIVLIPHFGIVGAALASAVSYTLCSLLFLRVFTRQTGVAWSALLFPRREDWRMYRRFLRPA